MAGVMRGVLGIGSKVGSPLKSQVRGMLNPGPPVNPLTKTEAYVGGFLIQVIIYAVPTYFLSQYPVYGRHEYREDRL